MIQKPTPTTEKVAPQMFTSKLNNYQTHGCSYNGKNYNMMRHKELSDYQNFLYNRALYGMKIYSQEEQETMFKQKRKRITKVHKRTQIVLNVWKQQLTNKYISSFFEKCFSRSSFTSYLADTIADTDPMYINKLSFKQLNISTQDIINKLIEENLLPLDFNNFKSENLCK